MINIVIPIILFIVGFCLGVFITNKSFDHQDWIMMKWNSSSLGYRTVSFGTKLMRGDKIIMALSLNTSSFPDEGITYDVE